MSYLHHHLDIFLYNANIILFIHTWSISPHSIDRNTYNRIHVERWCHDHEMVNGHLDYLNHHNWQEKHDTSAAQSKHEPHCRRRRQSIQDNEGGLKHKKREIEKGDIRRKKGPNKGVQTYIKRTKRQSDRTIVESILQGQGRHRRLPLDRS